VTIIKTKIWILILGLLLVGCVALSIFFFMPRQADRAEVFSDGKLLYTLDLHTDTQFTVQLGDGINIITVKDGKIAVTEANCPDGYCMKRGFCNGGTDIVCLPNRLVISFLGEQEVDGVVG
jgi:hypothetical protein